MSAALKSYVPRPVPSQQRTVATLGRSTANLSNPRPSVSPPVVLPTAPGVESPSPATKRLSQLHLVSSALAASLVALTLVSYGTSVYVNRQLNQASQRLNHLQRSEQQLTTANEVLKNHLAHQVERGELGFHPPQPNNVIFLKPTPQAPATALSQAGSQSLMGRLTLPKVDVPLGY